MIIPAPFTEALSETWLLERTYHAQLQNGSELSTSELTNAMKQLIGFSAPFSIWQEIAWEEKQAIYQQGIPVLLYVEQPWKYQTSPRTVWGPNKHMRVFIDENLTEHLAVTSGIDTAVCYLDKYRGNASNTSWNMRFSSADETIFADNATHAITFLRPYLQFPSTIHYTIISSDGHVSEYSDRAEAIKGFQLEKNEKNGSPSHSPQFCYYNEVTCPDGVYHIEFFGPRMDEPGYAFKEVVSTR